jgi:hypothetical protein
MSAIVAVTSPAEIERGTVYVVTWRDGTDPELVDLFTPRDGRRGVPGKVDPDAPPSWLMIGGRLSRLIDWIRRSSGDPGQLEFSPWTDLSDIADRFASVFGFPGRMGFDGTGMTGISVDGREYGGHVHLVEADVRAGAEVVVKPLDLGSGWISLHARVAPLDRVLSIPALAVATITANMLGSAYRRTRPEALAFLAMVGAGAHPSMTALLSQRRVSRGKSELEARAIRLGELFGLEAALPCSSLFEFAEHGGQAAIAIAPEFAPH